MKSPPTGRLCPLDSLSLIAPSCSSGCESPGWLGFLLGTPLDIRSLGSCGVSAMRERVIKWMSATTLLAILFGMFGVAEGSLDNQVVGEPRVFCGPEGIHVLIRTRDPFRGRLFVQDDSERSECVHSYVDGEAPPQEKIDTSAEFHLKFGSCNMRRQRTLSPRGVTFSFTMVVSFHPFFLTGGDRAFNVRCFFVEAVKAVDAAIDVSPLVTQIVEEEFQLPKCVYNLRQGHSGPLLRYANIGDPVTHVWECDPAAGWVYGVLIHSCYVDDGRGNRFELVNGRGCAVDRYLLGDLHYDERGLRAFIDSHVFKYADRVQLFFTCTVQLCFRQDGGCDGITPPACGPGDHRADILELPPHHPIGPRVPPGGPRGPPIDLHLPHGPPRGPIGPISSQLDAGPRLPPAARSALEAFRQIARGRGGGRPQGSSVEEYESPYARVLKDDAHHNESVDSAAFRSPTSTTISPPPLILNETTRRHGRDTLTAMETDLSAELTVMPLEGADTENSTVRRFETAALQHNLSLLCLGPLGVGSALSTLLLSILLSATTTAFCVIRHRRARCVARKIFLTD